MSENLKKWAYEVMEENVRLKEKNRELVGRNVDLLDALEEANRRAETYWNTVETIACGETLECPICQKRKPCLCDK
jgi:flagellar biosynthesis regulator FlaF